MGGFPGSKTYARIRTKPPEVDRATYRTIAANIQAAADHAKATSVARRALPRPSKFSFTYKKRGVTCKITYVHDDEMGLEITSSLAPGKKGVFTLNPAKLFLGLKRASIGVYWPPKLAEYLGDPYRVLRATFAAYFDAKNRAGERFKRTASAENVTTAED